MISVFHLSDSAWADSIPLRHSEEQLMEFHRSQSTKLRISKVAQVRTDDLNFAYQKTNTIDCSWLENPEVIPSESVKNRGGCRSTDIGDLMYLEKEGSVSTWIVTRFGFKELV